MLWALWAPKTHFIFATTPEIITLEADLNPSVNWMNLIMAKGFRIFKGIASWDYFASIDGQGPFSKIDRPKVRLYF